jgi:hypothetical protein
MRLRTIAGMIALALLATVTGVLVLAPPADHGAGRIQGAARSPASVAASMQRAQGQILFGDLHVHSTFSIDAFIFSLPLFAGEGAHPPADACDFARHCAAVDFFSLNDHAEGLSSPLWSEIRESIRQCNAIAGDPKNPDLVAFTGFEWTQVGSRPEEHYGHRNIVFPGTDDSELPARPITALPPGTSNRARGLGVLAVLEKGGPLGLGPYADLLWQFRQIASQADCDPDLHPRELPPDCRESAQTPAELFEKLDQWDFPHLVIPHGLARGIHAPPGAGLEASLAAGNHDPENERLIEIFSGHGNSEEFRDFAEAARNDAGERVCPAPTPDYLPCCWQAGEIMRARCDGLSPDVCDARVEEARQLALDAGVSPSLVFPDTREEDWLDCDQCRDCFKPAMSLRPRESAQYSLAIRNFEPEADDPDRFRWGFIASTDNHAARPATGYKQYSRKGMTDARGFASERVESWVRPFVKGRQQDRQRAQAAPVEERGIRGLLDVEREASFMYPGGIVAVHSEARDRESIWDALMRREVYGTSGPRILLWFDLLNAGDEHSTQPMGSSGRQSHDPEFEVRAVGAFVQKPGCPEESHTGLDPERLQRLCRGECYHPSDRRHAIRAIEVVRIRPQREPGEGVAPLIEDPWRRFECPDDEAGCRVRFSDPEFAASGRSAVYYVRALQESSPAVNGANLRTQFDTEGRAVRTRPCFGNYRTPPGDDCLSPVAERAWSSPIYVDYAEPSAGLR